MTTRWASAPDQDIVTAATGGDRDAFAALHDRYAPRIYSRFLYELRDVADAQDATQQTFVEAWRALPQLRNPAALPGWLATIADRQAMSSRRPRRFQEEPVTWGLEHADPTPGPDAEAMRSEARQLVQDALTSLMPRYQQALRYLMDHGQAGSGLAAELQVEPAQASRLADKAMHSLGDAVRALVLARTGRTGCSRLDELLRDAGWTSGPLSAELRTSVQRHAGQCAQCGEQRQAVGRRVIAALPAVFPVFVPPSLRDAILADAPAATSAARAAGASAGGGSGGSPGGSPSPGSGSTGAGGRADAPAGTGRGSGPWRRRAIAAGAGAAVLAAAVLVLRGGDDGGTTDTAARGGSGPAGASDDADAGPSLTDLDLHGLAVFDQEGDMNGGNERVRFVDPETGEDRASLSLATDSIAEITWRSNVGNNERVSRQAFSPDWRYVAGTVEGVEEYASTVWVQELDPATGAYHDLLRIDGNDAGSYSTDPVGYRNPRFAPDGETLWMESLPLGGTEMTLVSIDVPSHEEGAAPTESGLSFEYEEVFIGGALDVPSYAYWMLDDAGEPFLTLPDDRQPIYEPGSEEPLLGERERRASYVLGPDGDVVDLSVYLPNTHGAGDPSSCTDLGRTDGGDFLVGRCDGSAVSRAHVDPAAGTLELTELVPLGAAGTPDEVLLSPDGSEVLMQVDETWYRASLDDAGSEPHPVEGLDVDFRGMDVNTGAFLAWE
jgi:RNA polymerase sigma factor (sigma-70 family)